MPGVINSVLIIIFGKLYVKLSKWLVLNENHRYVSSFENSMINKIYMVQFVNTYIGNFVAIAYNQNFYTLTMNLFTVMVFKQIGKNLFEMFYEWWKVGRDVRKVQALFAPKIEGARLAGDEIATLDLKMHQEIEKQYRME